MFTLDMVFILYMTTKLFHVKHLVHINSVPLNIVIAVSRETLYGVNDVKHDKNIEKCKKIRPYFLRYIV